MTVVAFIALAAVATVIRALVTGGQAGFPWRTLVLNLAGAFALGLLWFRDFDHEVAVTVAGLGSLTTFSTVAAEVARLLDDNRRSAAMAYLGLTVIGGIAAAQLGLTIGEPT